MIFYTSRLTHPNTACVDTMTLAVELFSVMGRFAIAAKHLLTISEIYEKDIVNLEKAIETLERVCPMCRAM